MKVKKFVVTAFSRLSMREEVISGPVNEDIALRMKSKLLMTPARSRPYIRIKIKPFPYEGMAKVF